MATLQAGRNGTDWIICRSALTLEEKIRFGLQDGADPRSVQGEEIKDRGGLSLFRKVFSGKDVLECGIEATALGVYELFCNGRRVGRTDDGKTVFDELKPGWTDYHKRVLSDTYDLTPYLDRNGENTLLAAVAPGWWSGRISCGEYGWQPCAFCASLQLRKKNGNTEIGTGRDWETAFGGPVRSSDIWDGEIYDARIPSFAQISGGSEAGLSWEKAEKIEHPEIKISRRVGPQIRIRSFLEQAPASFCIYDGSAENGSDFGKTKETARGNGFEKVLLHSGQTLLIDFAQEIVGWPVLTCRAERGTEVHFRVGEMLNDSGSKDRGNDGPQGSLYTSNYRSAKAKGRIVCSGDTDTFVPMFSFYGFRYVEIYADGDAEISAVRGVVIGSEVPETGTLETSHPLVNRLIENIIWGQRGNYLSVPTDCPQRDERFGWTGDTEIFCRTASYNGNVDAFFHKWLQDARDSQKEDGAYTDIIPGLGITGSGNAAWGDAGIIVPYTMYLMYGDTELLAEHFESMEKYMAYLREHDGPKSGYSDWVSFESIDPGIIPLAFYGMDATLMAQMSGPAGHPDREEHYKQEFERAKKLYRDKYIGSDGKVVPTSQTGYLMPLAAGFLESEEVAQTVLALKEKIRANGYRLSTGFVGTGVLNQVLSACGEDGLAYSLLLQEECPSWLYSVNQGATTMWERWNSYTIRDGFGDVRMNSFNHYAYGAVGEWMYRFMCGIEPDVKEPAFRHFFLQPRPDIRQAAEIPEGQEKITYAKATYASVAGMIESGWEMKEGTLVYRCAVPAGTSATLTLPSLGKKTYTKNGQRFSFTGKDETIELACGKYEFSV